MEKPKLIVVNSNDIKIGQKYKTDLQPGEFIRCTSIWIENEKGEILLAQRAFNKTYDPGKWGPAAGGGVEVGETYLSNIIKETSEEIGVELKENEVSLIDKYFFTNTNAGVWCSQFFGVINSSVEIKIEESEVANYRWVTWDILQKEILEQPDSFIIDFEKKTLKLVQNWKKQSV